VRVALPTGCLCEEGGGECALRPPRGAARCARAAGVAAARGYALLSISPCVLLRAEVLGLERAAGRESTAWCDLTHCHWRCLACACHQEVLCATALAITVEWLADVAACHIR
jgi:hypothetical protein